LLTSYVIAFFTFILKSPTIFFPSCRPPLQDLAATDFSAGSLDEFSNAGRVIKSAICAGVYPNLVRVVHPAQKYQEVLGGAFAKDAEARELKFFTHTRGRVFLHPSSVNFSCGAFDSPWLIFTEIFETSKPFVRESSMVGVWGLLLFGGDLQVDHETQLLRADDWAEFKAPSRVAVLVREVRNALESILASKVENPDLDLSESKVIAAIHGLLISDGF
jgi:ATP-dependent RNA helicase DHX57